MANRKVVVTVSADTRKFQRAMKNLGQQSGVSSLAAMGKAVAKYGAMVGAAAVAAGGKTVQMASKLEQSAGAIKDIFKGSAGQMENFAAKAAETAGLSKNSYNELATVLGAQLKNGGTSMKDLAVKTDDLIRAGADMAAMFGGDTKTAVESISSALKGERDPIEKYGVSLKQAAIDAEAARLGFQKVGGTFDNEAQQAATLSLIMKQTTDAHGKFGKEATTLQGALQILKAKLENFATGIGTKLLPYVTQAVNMFGKKLMPALEKSAKYFETVILPAAVNLGKELKTKLAPVVKEAGEAFKNYVIPAVKTVAKAALAILPHIASLIAFLVEWKGVLIPLAGAIAAPVLALYTLHRAVKTARATMVAFKSGANLAKKTVAMLKNDVTTAKNGFNHLKTAASQAGGKLKTIAGTFKSVATNAAKATLQLARNSAAWVANKAKMVAHLAVLVAQKVATVIAAGAQTALNLAMSLNPIGLIITAIAALIGIFVLLYKNSETVRNIVSACWEGIKTAVSTVIDFVGGLIKSFIGVVQAIWSGGWDGIANFIGKAWNTIKTAVSNGITSAVNLVKGLPTRARQALGNLGSLLHTAGRDLIQGFINGIGSMASAIWEACKNIAKKAINSIKSFLGIASPSKVFTEIGKFTGQGLVKGLASMEGETAKAARKLAQAAEIQPEINAVLKTTHAPGIRPGTGQAPQITINLQCLRPDTQAAQVIVTALKDYYRLNGRAIAWA